LSDLSQHAVVVTTPRPSHDLLEHLEFMRLPSGVLLAVLVAQSGQVQNKLVHPEAPVAAEEIERINNYLNHRLDGLSLGEVRRRVAEELATERVQADAIAKRALELSQAALPEAGDALQVIVAGRARLIEQAAEVDPSKLPALVRALEEKELLL